MNTRRQLRFVALTFAITGSVGAAVTISNFANGTCQVDLAVIAFWFGLRPFNQDVRVLRWARRFAILGLIISALVSWTLFVRRDDPELLNAFDGRWLSASRYNILSLVVAAVSLGQYLVLRTQSIQALFDSMSPGISPVRFQKR